ncbi:MAG: hypothetical protein R3C54_13275 [Parvularculaceae bacterium]|nr:hypothetical protein [Amphiplicatus sp.]MCB9955577.1 hypothetical protein [Caulobacterales bacterium]HRX40428.1 hypothetical protein [Parvularculaceae bacterium]
MALEEYLSEGEEILWRGVPSWGLIFRWWDVFYIPFTFVWAAFSFFWTLLVVSSGAPPGFVFMGCLFSLFGIYIFAGRFAVDIVRRIGTQYAVTNKRAIILSGIFSKSFDAMRILPSTRIKISGKRRGSIYFGEGHGFYDMWRSFALLYGPDHPFAFERIRDVQRVYEIVLSVQEQTLSASKSAG